MVLLFSSYAFAGDVARSRSIEEVVLQLNCFSKRGLYWFVFSSSRSDVRLEQLASSCSFSSFKSLYFRSILIFKIQ